MQSPRQRHCLRPSSLPKLLQETVPRIVPGTMTMDRITFLIFVRDCLAFQSAIGTGIVPPTSSTSLTAIELDRSPSLHRDTVLNTPSGSQRTRDWSVVLDNGIGRGRRLTFRRFAASKKLAERSAGREEASTISAAILCFGMNADSPCSSAALRLTHRSPSDRHPHLLRRNRLSSLVSLVLRLLRHGTTLVPQRASVRPSLLGAKQVDLLAFIS